MSIVVGMNDPNYYESKAIELINEAKLSTNDLNIYHDKIAKAISLLALARIMRE